MTRRMARSVLWILGAAAVAGAGLAAGGCGGGRERRAERREERFDDRMDRRIEARTGWQKLGERVVHGRNDRDTIVVTAAEGRFRRIMLVVEHSALEMDNIVITFGNGETWSPDTRAVFAEDSRSRVIDLPGGDRVIRSVHFRYGNLPGGGRAQIELWAQ